MISDNHEYVCPLAAVDKRLSDAHDLWHRAETSYFDPDTFRIDSQHLIQTLRTVTFILQANKHVIPSFDSWYAGQQEKMRSDPLLRWLVDARNTIEKRGDLEAYSYVRAQILASHVDNFPMMEIKAELFENLDELFSRVPAPVLQQHVMQHGVLRVDRRWVHADLPDVEVLDALAEAYGKLSLLVNEAHAQVGVAPPVTREDGSTRDINREGIQGRMPCMIGHEDRRALLLHLANGQRLSMRKRAHPLPKADNDRIMKRYGKLPAPLTDFNNMNAVADHFFTMARAMMTKDGHHIPVAFIFHGDTGVRQILTPAEDRQDKYLISRALANEVKELSAHTVITIGEAWTASEEDVARYGFPADVPNRQEVLMLQAVKRTGEMKTIQARIRRKWGKVRLQPSEVAENAVPFSMAPILKHWGIDLPEVKEAELNISSADKV